MKKTPLELIKKMYIFDFGSRYTSIMLFAIEANDHLNIITYEKTCYYPDDCSGRPGILQ